VAARDARDRALAGSSARATLSRQAQRKGKRGRFTIAVDFDGTIVEHAYPEMGALVPGAIEVLKDCVARGSKLVLFTVARSARSSKTRCALLQDNGVALHAVNRNRRPWPSIVAEAVTTTC
jgi:beta-phosphoglucomutase-like phosphatase (HAD superfamily)